MLAPWLLSAALVTDAHRHVRLARLPAPLDAKQRAEALGRLEREVPTRVTRFVKGEYTIASGREELWSVMVMRFADGVEHVVTDPLGPAALDHDSQVLAGARARADEEIHLGFPALAFVPALLAMPVWATALALCVSPRASLFVLAPLPLALVLHAIARRGARHVIDAVRQDCRVRDAM